MVDVIDDFDSVMNQVMKELESEEYKAGTKPQESGLSPEIFNEVVEYKGAEKLSDNDVQVAADLLVKDSASLFEKKAKAQPQSGKTGTGCFSIDLEGILGVDLRLKFGERELFVTCDDEQLIIRLGDGTVFNIPFKGKIEKAA
jgi:hypothetical protein